MTCVNISAERAHFCVKFYTTVNQQYCMYTSPQSFVELYLKRTKLCCFNQEPRHFSTFERHADPAASELSRVHLNSPDEQQWTITLDYHVWSTMLEKCYTVNHEKRDFSFLTITLANRNVGFNFCR